MSKLKEFYRAHKFAIIFVAIAIVLCILFFTIGFWRSLLLFVIIGVFFLIGFLLDQNGIEGVKDFFKKLFSSKK